MDIGVADWLSCKMRGIGWSRWVGPNNGHCQISREEHSCSVNDLCGIIVLCRLVEAGSGMIGRFTRLWYVSFGVTGGPSKVRLVGIVAKICQCVVLVWDIIAALGRDVGFC